MMLSYQTITFLQFILIGGVLALIYDIFRAYRKHNKKNRNFVVLQDIIFFIISLVVLVFSLVMFLNESIRFYLIIAIVLGISIYLSFLSKYIINLYIKFFDIWDKFINFIFIPFRLILEFFRKICIKIKKIVKKACKKSKNVIIYICNKFKNIIIKFNIQKRFKNEKTKNKRKKFKKE